MLGAASLSVLAGVALLAVVTTVIGVLGGPTRPLPVALPLVVVAFAGIVPGLGRPGPRRRPVSRAGDVVTALLAAGIGARLAVAAARVPVISWDEFKMWALRGRVMSVVSLTKS